MAKKSTLRSRIDSLIDEMEPKLAKAFRASIDDIKSNVALRRIVDALERHDIEAAIEAMNLDRAAYAPLQKAIEDAYAAGGATTIAASPAFLDRSGRAVVVRFDIRNPRAEQWLRYHSSELVTNVLDDQKLAVRTAIEAGYAKGQGPRNIALDVVGRFNRSTGKREGGVIGLTNQQTAYVTTARAELASGDPALLRNYLTRARRDKRFDSRVLAAIRDGKELPADTIKMMAARYESSLLKLRGEMVARTETLQAVNAARFEAFSQGLEATGYTKDAVERTWRTARDSRVRHTHAEMDGQTVPGLDTPFTSPSGAQMMYPGDTSLGAGPSEIIACRCDVEMNIDYSQGLE